MNEPTELQKQIVAMFSAPRRYPVIPLEPAALERLEVLAVAQHQRTEQKFKSILAHAVAVIAGTTIDTAHSLAEWQLIITELEQYLKKYGSLSEATTSEQEQA
jgi:hypothetical protein